MKRTTMRAAISRPLCAVAIAATALCTALGGAALPAAAATAQPADAAPLSAVTFTSAGNGLALDVQNGTTGAGPIVVTDSAPGYDESWHIAVTTTDAPFTIVNNTTGECIDAGLPLRVQACDGRSTEQWYFEPVAGSAQNAFMIRQATGGDCLDLLLDAQYSDAWTDTYGCNGTAAQQWTLPAAAVPTAFGMAADYAATQCENNSATCTWTTDSQTAPAPLPIVCVSPVWYNDTTAAVPFTFQLNTTTGWSDTIGYTLTTKLSAGADKILESEIDSAVNGSVTTNLSQTLGNSITISVPIDNYGWVALSELATQVTGNWTFDLQGFPWTAEDTVTVPLTSDSTGATSYYLARTSPSFTSCSS